MVRSAVEGVYGVCVRVCSQRQRESVCVREKEWPFSRALSLTHTHTLHSAVEGVFVKYAEALLGTTSPHPDQYL